MIIGMLGGFGLIYLGYIVRLLEIMVKDDLFYNIEQHWRAASFAGKTIVILYLVTALPAIVLYVFGSLCVSIYYFADEKCFPGLYHYKDTYGIRVVMPENNVLNLLRENKISFSIGDDFIRFPSNKIFNAAKEFLGSYKIYEE